MVTITPRAWADVERGAATVAAIVAEGRTVYGVNTGFGLLANTSIAPQDLETLQKNLVLSHACGVGPLLPDAVTRLLMVLKIASLSRGASGIRRETLEALVAPGQHRHPALHSVQGIGPGRPAIWRRWPICPAP